MKNTGLKCGSPAFYALAVLLSYLKETQKKGVERLKTVHNYAEAQYMQLSPVTWANLELTETMRDVKAGNIALGFGQNADSDGKTSFAELDRAAACKRECDQ